jgi:transcription antitermination protein NusB
VVNPKVRRRGRERALQFLFSLDFTEYSVEDKLEDFWAINPARPGARQYAEKLIHGVSNHQEALDQEISGALDNWTPDRIGHIERSAIRIALFEMRHFRDVPEAVAINEALEVVKTFGADDAPKFVNGVLGRLKGSTKKNSA